MPPIPDQVPHPSPPGMPALIEALAETHKLSVSGVQSREQVILTLLAASIVEDATSDQPTEEAHEYLSLAFANSVWIRP